MVVEVVFFSYRTKDTTLIHSASAFKLNWSLENQVHYPLLRMQLPHTYERSNDWLLFRATVKR